ncbi:gluconate kinase [Mangrovibacter phragmitis]|jgi:gluconokinase|uniref:Gluconokinase n=1 Tax=Mangrovibacter phragmitis TaxID=1691903 RepID=A0A1B7L2V0_9ENTR|nr:gluconokinase [Mangrovibacter phragmitis]OAT76545.1 gluconate kinase [Mangrovibacter phragmitis]
MAGKSIILMGVSGSGKSLVGTKLAQQLPAKFIDGDDLHPRNNIDKMSRGESLNDDDRFPWLARLNDVSYSLYKKNEVGIIVCSSLKRIYRDKLREGSPNIIFLWLKGDYETIYSRMADRAGHFMPVTLLQSQFATLEEPQADETDVFAVDVNATVEEVTARCIAVLQSLNPE